MLRSLANNRAAAFFSHTLSARSARADEKMDVSRDDAPARAARIDAPLLNARLSKAQNSDELLDLFDRHGWQAAAAPLPAAAHTRQRLSNSVARAPHCLQMDGMHYGNLWNKLGRQLRETAARQAWVAQHAATLQRLVSATTGHLRTCGAQPLANIAHGAAHVGLPAALAEELFRAAAEAAEPELARWAPRHLANLTWACAQAGHGGGARFYTALAAASRPQLAAFNPLELGMLAAAFAKAEQRAFTRDLCRAVRRSPSSLGPQELSP